MIPPSADLLRFDVRATAAGVCVRWTTAAPVSPGAHLIFLAFSPFVRESNGDLVAFSYGVDLEIRRNDARATFGLARLGSTAQHVMHVRVGRTGSIVSAFIPDSELNRIPEIPADPNRPPFPYRAFTFEVRVLSAPDASGNSRADSWPQEGGDGEAADIDGRLCAKPCKDHRFYP